MPAVAISPVTSNGVSAANCVAAMLSPAFQDVFGEREESEKPRGTNYTIFCYLERAIRFRPEDGTARLMLGTYLVKHKRRSDAAEHLDVAVSNAGENANLHYNLGLVFFDLQEYEKARQHAQKAYGLGYDLPGLRKKLERVGKWAAPAGGSSQ